MQKETCLKVEQFGERGVFYFLHKNAGVVVKGVSTNINYREVVLARNRKLTCNTMYAYDLNKLINAM